MIELFISLALLNKFFWTIQLDFFGEISIVNYLSFNDLNNLIDMEELGDLVRKRNPAVRWVNPQLFFRFPYLKKTRVVKNLLRV